MLSLTCLTGGHKAEEAQGHGSRNIFDEECPGLGTATFVGGAFDVESV